MVQCQPFSQWLAGLWTHLRKMWLLQMAFIFLLRWSVFHWCIPPTSCWKLGSPWKERLSDWKQFRGFLGQRRQSSWRVESSLRIKWLSAQKDESRKRTSYSQTAQGIERQQIDTECSHTRPEQINLEQITKTHSFASRAIILWKLWLKEVVKTKKCKYTNLFKNRRGIFPLSSMGEATCLPVNPLPKAT